MKNSISVWQLVGFAFTSVFGTLLHFLYEWTGSRFAALFSGVNESTWEHMKLIFFPMLLFALIESRFIEKDFCSFWCIKLKGILLGLFLIPIIFYTVNGAFGRSPDWFNISIFFIAAAIAYFYETVLFKKDTPCKHKKAAIALLSAIAIAFWVFTFYPPQIPLFLDPVTNMYGIA
ncbi:MAG: hypothetical protein E7587_08535 [Ruminococcaceae bacterium]|nr:hypothetical protein [Oscillospiraceae bacterium]